MSKPVYIVEEIQQVVAQTATKYGRDIYYMYGHPIEIVNRLQEMSSGITTKNKKFPLIALFTDIPLNVEKIGYYGEVKLQLIIATLTDPNYNAPQRLEQTFKPVLYPIRDTFIDEIVRHKQFDSDIPSYITTDRFYWGKQGLYGNTGNIFNDFIDAIEISNLRITIKNKIC